MRGQSSLELLIVIAAILSATLFFIQPVSSMKISGHPSLYSIAQCNTVYLNWPQFKPSFTMNPVVRNYDNCLATSTSQTGTLRVQGEKTWL